MDLEKLSQTLPLLLRTAAGAIPKQRWLRKGKGDPLTRRLKPSPAGEMKRISNGNYVTYPHGCWRLSLGTGPSTGFALLIQMGSGFPGPGCSMVGRSLSLSFSVVTGPSTRLTEFRLCVRPLAELGAVGAVARIQGMTCDLRGEQGHID